MNYVIPVIVKPIFGFNQLVYLVNGPHEYGNVGRITEIETNGDTQQPKILYRLDSIRGLIPEEHIRPMM